MLPISKYLVCTTVHIYCITIMIPIFIPIQSKREHSFQVVQTKEPQIIIMDLCVYTLMENGGRGSGWYWDGTVTVYVWIRSSFLLLYSPIGSLLIAFTALKREVQYDLSLVLLSRSLSVIDSIVTITFLRITVSGWRARERRGTGSRRGPWSTSPSAAWATSSTPLQSRVRGTPR